ncbi:MAG: hypothetical protein QM771_05800 [Nitrospira sp.]
MGKPSTRMSNFWRGGELFVWMTASGVAISLLMVAGMLALIMFNGLGQFWPRALQQVTLKTQETVIGQLVGEETIPHSMTTETQSGQRRYRYRVRQPGSIRFRVSVDQRSRHRVHLCSRRADIRGTS